MYTYTYTYIYTCISIHMYIYIHVYIRRPLQASCVSELSTKPFTLSVVPLINCPIDQWINGSKLKAIKSQYRSTVPLINGSMDESLKNTYPIDQWINGLKPKEQL